jgi:peptidoglycan/LPS O-acetylase OafA/YrhL
MLDVPPTSPIPLRRPQRRRNMTLVGMAIHGGCVFMACLIVPLAMQFNLWPISIVIWTVLTVPPALATGALTGWVLRKLRPSVAISALVFTGIAIALVLVPLIRKS